MVADMQAEYCDLFVSMFDDSDAPATDALLYLARRCGIAVAWMDRAAVEATVRKLTDEEWARLVPELGGYDEHVSGENTDMEMEFLRKVFEDAEVSFD